MWSEEGRNERTRLGLIFWKRSDFFTKRVRATHTHTRTSSITMGGSYTMGGYYDSIVGCCLVFVLLLDRVDECHCCLDLTCDDDDFSVPVSIVVVVVVVVASSVNVETTKWGRGTDQK